MPKARPGLMPARQQMAVSTDALSAQGRCHCGQPSLLIAVTNHIDGVGCSHNDGITWRRSESGTLG
jgi:hypothetical protein